MIEINLVPPHLRKKRKTSGTPQPVVAIPKQTLIGLGGGLLALLLMIHVGLQLTITTKYLQHKKNQHVMQELAPAKSQVDTVLKELKVSRERLTSTKEAIGDKKIIWAQKLNGISDHLPRGVWLSKIILGEEALSIKGSAVSKNNTEMLIPHQFRSRLMEDENFRRGFSDIDLNALTSRKVNELSIADFLIRAVLK